MTPHKRVVVTVCEGSLLLAWGSPAALVNLHRPVMGLESLGKEMGTIILGDEIKIGNRCRSERGPKRRKAWIADRPGRKTLDAVSIIGTQILKMFAGDRAGKIIETIDDRRIALERHVSD